MNLRFGISKRANHRRRGFGGGSQTTQSSSNSSPWSGQQPYLTSLFSGAQNQYQNYTPQYYGMTGTAGGTPTQTGGSTVAPLNGQETGSIANIDDLGNNLTTPMMTANSTINTIAGANPNSNPSNSFFNSVLGSGTQGNNPANSTLSQIGSGAALNNPGNSAYQNYANGSMLSAGNPYFQSMANQVQSSMLPGLMSSFTQGSTDNPNVAFAANQGLGNALGGLAYQNYQQGQQNQLAAGQGLSSNFNTGVGNTLGATGQQGQNYFQGLGAQLGAAGQIGSNYNTNISNSLNAASTAPYLYNTQLGGANAALTAGQVLQNQAQQQLSNQVNGYNYYQQLPYSQINQFSNLIGGQYGGVQTGSTSTPQQSMLGSLFSDKKLKENVRRVGKLDNGLPVYAFNYLDDKKTTHIGLLAQEVEKVHPNAVSSYHSLKMVDYAKAVLPLKKDEAA